MAVITTFELQNSIPAGGCACDTPRSPTFQLVVNVKAMNIGLFRLMNQMTQSMTLTRIPSKKGF